jgi:2-polyprenyl-3-methyl-5-hydroxy-6-metoxy-1,4-benzoquinol methylase
MVHTSNYNSWQYDQFRPYIGKKVLEIGCGLGNITQFLARDAEYVLSVDIKQEAVDYTRQRIQTGKNIHIECLDIFTEGLKQYSRINFDTIVFSNVLEHIEDDVSTMRTCHDILQKANGTLLLLVPAHMWMYGTIDKEVGHYRRYEKDDIVTLADKSKFRILDLYEFNMLGALGWYVNYCLLKRKNTNNEAETSQVGLYDKWLVNPTRWIESKIPPAFGISYVAVLKA